jgi:hypothetical protein
MEVENGREREMKMKMKIKQASDRDSQGRFG